MERVISSMEEGYIVMRVDVWLGLRDGLSIDIHNIFSSYKGDLNTLILAERLGLSLEHAF